MNVTGMEDLNGGLRLTFSDRKSFDVTKDTMTSLSTTPKGDSPEKLTAELQKMIDAETNTVKIHVYSLSPLQFQTILGQYIPEKWWDGLQPKDIVK